MRKLLQLRRHQIWKQSRSHLIYRIFQPYQPYQLYQTYRLCQLTSGLTPPQPSARRARPWRLKLTARDALRLGIIEAIVPERELGQRGFYTLLADRLEKELHLLLGQPDLLARRYQRFRALGRPSVPAAE